MGKGKADRARSNGARKRRKSRLLGVLKHLTKHPNYYNSKNPIPWSNFCLIWLLYMLLLSNMNTENKP